MTMLPKETADAFVTAITERPNDFGYDQGRFCLVDRKTGQEWWVASGSMFFAPYPGRTGFSFWQFLTNGGSERRRCWRAYQRWSLTPRKMVAA